MLAQYTAASLVSENKVLAHPASVDTIPTSGKQEDHVLDRLDRGPQLRDVVNNVRACLAVEICCAAQGIDLRADVAEPSVPLEAVHAVVRAAVPRMESTARWRSARRGQRPAPADLPDRHRGLPRLRLVRPRWAGSSQK